MRLPLICSMPLWRGKKRKRRERDRKGEGERERRDLFIWFTCFLNELKSPRVPWSNLKCHGSVFDYLQNSLIVLFRFDHSRFYFGLTEKVLERICML